MPQQHRLATIRAFIVAAVLAALSHTSNLRAAEAAAKPAQDEARMFAEVDRLFEDFMLDAHIPGLVYGIVAEGQLAHVRGLGVQELESRRPVTPDTLFRIASMTKAFTALTILELRDEGKLRLDEPVETYVPELREWKYPTVDSPRVRVTRMGGMVKDFLTSYRSRSKSSALFRNRHSAMARLI